VRCAFVSAQRDRHGVSRLSRALRIARSTYYAWQTRPPSARSVEDAKLLREIRRIHQENHRVYGSPRIHEELVELGYRVGRKRVERLMREEAIRARHFRRYRHTTQSGHRLPVAPNHLRQQFQVGNPNAVWASDITYLWTGEGWVYLAVIMDLCSRRIVGWSMGHRIEKRLVMAAMRQALHRRAPESGLLHHSDQGSQYASNEYQMLLKRHGIRSSMSERGNCYDNAPVESFFASLKRERTSGKYYATREEARRDIFDYVEVFYNRRRRHSGLGNISPAEFERRREECA